MYIQSQSKKVEELLKLYERWTRFVPQYDLTRFAEKRKDLDPRIRMMLRRAGYMGVDKGPRGE